MSPGFSAIITVLFMKSRITKQESIFPKNKECYTIYLLR